MMKIYSPKSYRRKGQGRVRRALHSGQSRYRQRAQDLLANFLEHDERHRLMGMIIIASTVIILFIIRLFYLQGMNGEYYLAKAQEQQYGKIIIPAKRGEILTENFKTGELNKIATNTTLDLVYIDPKEIPDKAQVAKALAPILFDEEDFLACKEDYSLCPSGGVKFDEAQILVNNEGEKNKEKEIKDIRTREQLILAYEHDLLEKISKEEVDYSPFQYGASDELMDAVEQLSIYGVFVVRNKNLIYADPTRVDQLKIKSHAKALAPLLKEDEDYIQRLLTRRPVRYIPLKRRLSPEASEAIWELKTQSYQEHKKDIINIPHYFKGVVLIPEHWRYYPENTLASTAIGYVDHEGYGRYGIEEKFDIQLKGKQGVLLSKNDVHGAQLVFDVNNMTNAVDGESIVLTIDRSVQYKVDEILKKAVEKYKADSGTVIIMEPFTGEILAMSDYPNFNPNSFGDVYEFRKTHSEDWENYAEGRANIYPTQPVFIREENNEYKQVNYQWILDEKELIKEAEKQKESGEKDIEVPEEQEKYVYKNRFGLGAYLNRAVMTLYEPGSVFKPVAMAIGLDAKEVTPNETYREDGPIEIDTGTGKKQYIRTALGIYRGIQTMTNAIEQSSNIGMAYVARKLGRELFYKYILDFGFGDYTDIGLVGEQKGAVTFWKKWPEAQLLTTSFGQGISVTPLQMITSWSALANGGILVQPRIVKAIINPDGKKKETEVVVLERVISKESSQQITAMLVSSVENGVAAPGKVEGYRIAGKTGTSQIACSDAFRCRIGKYETGEGSTITSFAGYAPIAKPKFVVLVKFERPRIGDNTWGSTTAAPVFREIMEFLLQYYDISPDDL